MMSIDELALNQQILAQTGNAAGQCKFCLSYRLDGTPPILHKEDCKVKRADFYLAEANRGDYDGWKD